MLQVDVVLYRTGDSFAHKVRRYGRFLIAPELISDVTKIPSQQGSLATSSPLKRATKHRSSEIRALCWANGGPTQQAVCGGQERFL